MGPRRSGLVALALAVLVGLIVANVVLDSGETEPEREPVPEAQPDVSGPLTTTTTVPESTDPEPSDQAGLIVGGDIGPVVGFEGHWLVVIDSVDIDPPRAIQVPLDGGEVEQLVRPPPPDGAIRHDPVLVHGVVVTPSGGWSLHDGSWWPLAGPTARRADRVLGTTTEGSATIATDDAVIEWWTDDIRRQSVTASPVVGDGHGDFVGVAGRQIIHHGPSGIYRLDLDSGQVVGLGPGSVLAVGIELLLIEVCDDALICQHQIAEVAAGTIRSTVASTLDVGRFGIGSAVFSPDDDRLAVVLEQQQIAVIDTATGSVLGVEALAGSGETTWLDMVWAPDSSAVLVVAQVEDERRVVLVDASGGGARRLFDLEAALGASGGRFDLLVSDQGFRAAAGSARR